MLEERTINSLDEIKENEGKDLVLLARKSIEEYLKRGIIVDLKEVPYENWLKKGASFVTLENRYTGQLRGCIGSIIPVQPLYKDVIRNAIAAATQDPRFIPVSKEEIPDLKVKVSVLSFPEPLHYENLRDLLEKIKPFEDGLILKYGQNQGTFLPDVWEDLPDKELFLSHLCLKAGLPQDCWLRLPIEIFRYRTKVFSD